MRFRLLGLAASLKEIASWWDNNWRQADNSLAALEDSTTGAVMLDGGGGTQTIDLDANAATTLEVSNDSTGASAQAVVKVSSDNADVSLVAHGSGATATLFGTAQAGYGNVVSSSSSGLMIGTTTNTPLVLGTRDIESVRIDGTPGNVILKRLGAGLRITEGANARMGTATLVAGTVTVNNTTVTANTRIFAFSQVNGVAGALRCSARVAGTSFTITSSNAGDAGACAWILLEPS